MAASYEVLCSVKADGDIPVTKYKSKKTGLSVVIAEVEGPLVNGYFCLATEAHDDDGLPHTLEHLVFMGSEQYPYKGVLDLLANRCLASGTNAWTDTDHTCYTMTTAGSQGFLNLMPIYLDHIIYPTLTEAGYITEVHHVNGEGENAGVVYCEMQARENSGESRTHLELVRAMYPGHCGYKSETGGIMQNLRESTSHTKVCNYHKEFYRPDNLCCIITGQIKVEDVFAAIQPFEDRVVAKGKLPDFSRPWQSEVPSFPASVEKELKYPADDDSSGIVCVAWRGPPAKDTYTYESLTLFLDYLTDSPIAPLQRDFVEIDEPYCSDVHGSQIENAEGTVYFKFENVDSEKLKDVYKRVEETLSGIRNGKEKLDMGRVANLVHRRLLDALSSMEESPHDKMASFLIGDFLFSDNQKHLENRVQTKETYKRMKTEPEQYWLDLLNKYFTKNHCIILGEPSKSYMETMAKEEANRVAKQQDDLGTDGLKKLADVLQKATEDNEKEPPKTMLTSVDVPDVAAIHFHPISHFCNRPAEKDASSAVNKNAAFPLDNIPFRFELDDTHTNFVNFCVLLDSTCIPQELKYYLPLYCDVLFESPILRDGVLVTHESVISQLEADTLSTSQSMGVNGSKFSCGSFPQLVEIGLQVEREKYETGVKWLHEILYQTQFKADRLKNSVKRMMKEITKHKRKGQSVLKALIKTIVFTPESNHSVTSMLRQSHFLDALLKTLESDPKSVEENMCRVRDLLTHPDNLTLHMAVNVAELTKDSYKPQDVWSTLLPKQKAGSGDTICRMKPTYEYVIPMSDVTNKSIIVGVGSVESSFLIQAVPCVNSPLHEDLPAIMVYIQYLTQLEGPMWRQIRGLGLSYHYSMYAMPETGMLYFLLARSTHIVNAFKEGRDIVMNYVDGKTEFSDIEIESAKSSLTFEVIERETTVSDVSNQSLLSYLRHVPHSYNKDLLKLISKVTKADLLRVGAQYIAGLFRESEVRRAVCCNPSKVSEVVTAFKKLDVELKEITSLDDDFLCKLEK